MARPWEFQMATRVVFGRGALRRLGPIASEFGSSALVVGYGEESPVAATAKIAVQGLAKSGVAATPFFEVEQDPAVALVERGAQLAKQAGVGLIVAIGGGSVIDVAKGIAALAAMRDGSLWDFTDANRQSRPVVDALPVIAVPTTAGTGSEVTGIAVFEHSGVGVNPAVPMKASLYGRALAPRVAVIDPDLAVGTPASLTAASAADALAHAVEACLSRQANPWTNLAALEAVARITADLPQALADLAAPEPRESLALAAVLAGSAFNEAGVVVGHVMAHALGAVLAVPHATATAVCMSAQLRFNRDANPEAFVRLAEACRVAATNPGESADAVATCIESLLREAGLPSRIHAPAAERSDLLDTLVAKALESTPSGVTLNPRKVRAEELRSLFEEVLDFG